MAGRHEDIAVGGDHNVRWLIESIRTVPGNSRLAQGHQYFSLAAKLENLMTLAALSERIGHPDIAVFIDEETVWLHKQSSPEMTQGLSRRIKLEDGVEVLIGAIVRATPVIGPDVPVGTNIDAGGRAPLSSIRQLRPALHGLVGIGEIIGRRVAGLAINSGDGSQKRESKSTQIWHVVYTRGGNENSAYLT